jgi:hypothetical protein
MVLSPENEENGVCGVNWKRKRSMVVLVDGLVAGSEVPLRASWCKARGGGGRLRHAT